MLPTKRHVKIIKSVDGIFTPGLNYLKIKESVQKRMVTKKGVMVSAPGVLLVTSNFKSQSYKSADKSSLDKG